jgi:hypothetical protein
MCLDKQTVMFCSVDRYGVEHKQEIISIGAFHADTDAVILCQCVQHLVYDQKLYEQIAQYIPAKVKLSLYSLVQNEVFEHPDGYTTVQNVERVSSNKKKRKYVTLE